MKTLKTARFGAALLTGTLLLASCGGGETPQPQPQPQPQPTYGDARVIAGDIDPNQDLPGAVRVPLLQEDTLQAPVDAEGRFTLTLPETVADADLLDAGSALGCFDPAAVSAPAGNLFFPVRYVQGNNGRSYFNKTDSGADNVASVKRMRVYAKQDAQISITPTDSCPMAADLALKAGWNVVEETLPTSGVNSYKMTTLPAGAVIFRDTRLYAGSLSKN